MLLRGDMAPFMFQVGLMISVKASLNARKGEFKSLINLQDIHAPLLHSKSVDEFALFLSTRDMVLNKAEFSDFIFKKIRFLELYEHFA